MIELPNIGYFFELRNYFKELAKHYLLVFIHWKTFNKLKLFMKTVCYFTYLNTLFVTVPEAIHEEIIPNKTIVETTISTLFHSNKTG